MSHAYSRRTFSLSPEADQALERLMEMDEEPKASRLIDGLLRAEMDRRGFVLRGNTEDAMRIEILNEAGSPVPTTTHGGQTYVLAKRGERYRIRLTNSSSVRRLAVLSVDGVNVVDGSTASYDGNGYVLQPYQSFVIEGWLRDKQEAAAFRFGGEGQSYSEQTGRGAENLGVIGLAVFDQQHVIRTPHPSYWKSGQQMGGMWSSGGGPVYGSSGGEFSCSTAPTKTSAGLNSLAGAITRGASVGTAYGEKVAMHTSTTTFERCPSPCIVTTVRYGTKEDFAAWGVPLPSVSPNPFPGQAAVPPPPGWRF